VKYLPLRGAMTVFIVLAILGTAALLLTVAVAGYAGVAEVARDAIPFWADDRSNDE